MSYDALAWTCLRSCKLHPQLLPKCLTRPGCPDTCHVSAHGGIFCGCSTRPAGLSQPLSGLTKAAKHSSWAVPALAVKQVPHEGAALHCPWLQTPQRCPRALRLGGGKWWEQHRSLALACGWLGATRCWVLRGTSCLQAVASALVATANQWWTSLRVCWALRCPNSKGCCAWRSSWREARWGAGYHSGTLPTTSPAAPTLLTGLPASSRAPAASSWTCYSVQVSWL